MSDAQPQCAGSILETGIAWPKYRKCSRHGKIERDGKWYCKQHDPVAAEKRQTESSKRTQAVYDADQKVSKARDAKNAAVQAVIEAAKHRLATQTHLAKARLLMATNTLLEADQALTAALAERKALP